MKKKILIKTITLALYALLLLTVFNQNTSHGDVKKITFTELDTISKSQLKATQLGIGGGGALFQPAISPFDSNNMLVIPDMGGIYITHNKGEDWVRKNTFGTLSTATYDPGREGVIYAGGSGLYRSTDNGDNFELIFPRKEDIIAKRTSIEHGIQQYFTKNPVYDTYKSVDNILVDPENSDHIFILCTESKEGKVYESTDNGETFNPIMVYDRVNTGNINFDLNKLTYRQETKDLFVIDNKQIINYNLNTKIKKIEYKSPLDLVDVTTVYENNKTYFIIIEKTNELANSYTKVYYTNDFNENIDITEKFTSVNPTTFEDKWEGFGKVTYKYNFRFIAATSLNNIYVTNTSQPETTENGVYWTITGTYRYHNNESTHIYGTPFRSQHYLKTRLWNDYNTDAHGLAVSMTNEDEFLMTTLCGVIYSPNSVDLYPRYSKMTEGEYGKGDKYVTNGIDEQTTYGVREDPFHKNVILLLNTDLGLIRSEDNGKSWVRTHEGIPDKWVNTVYDLAFNEKHENVVYSIWSGRHDAPYYPDNLTDGVYGGFAISYDGGITWDAKYSSGIPDNAIPVKMSVQYQEDSEDVTIYIATFNEGFYVSYDSGKTFKEINEGIKRVSCKDGEDYQYILGEDIEVKDGHVFGITARSYYGNSVQPGELYEYIDNQWKKIEVPEYLTTPRDIYYHDGILYISATPTSIWDGWKFNNGIDYNNYGGGVYTYQNDEFKQIFDEGIAATSVQIDKRGTIFISDTNGNIYRKELNKDYKKIYDSYHYVSKGIELSEDGDYLYLASFGGGLLKLENLNSLYHDVHTGGVATCKKRAVCSICGKEYGELDPNNHELTTTHIINQKNPTYNEDGYTGDIVYDCCNKIKEKGHTIPKLQHENNEPKPTEPEKPSENKENNKDEIVNNDKLSNIELPPQTDSKLDNQTTKKTNENTSSREIKGLLLPLLLLIIAIILDINKERLSQK